MGVWKMKKKDLIEIIIALKAMAKMIREDFVEGYEDLKLEALLQLIEKGDISDDLLKNLCVLWLKK